jgi:hypothetical protein
MMRPRFQFRLKGLMLAVAIVAAPMLLLTPPSKYNTPIIKFIGNVMIGRDGSVEVRDGAVRVGQDGEQSEIRMSRIVVKKDSTTEAYGPCTISHCVR